MKLQAPTTDSLFSANEEILRARDAKIEAEKGHRQATVALRMRMSEADLVREAAASCSSNPRRGAALTPTDLGIKL